MARTVEEWRGATDDTPRKRISDDLTIAYFEERSIPEPNSGCWIWTKAINARNGYGAVRNAGKTK